MNDDFEWAPERKVKSNSKEVIDLTSPSPSHVISTSSPRNQWRVSPCPGAIDTCSKVIDSPAFRDFLSKFRPKKSSTPIQQRNIPKITSPLDISESPGRTVTKKPKSKTEALAEHICVIKDQCLDEKYRDALKGSKFDGLQIRTEVLFHNNCFIWERPSSVKGTKEECDSALLITDAEDIVEGFLKFGEDGVDSNLYRFRSQIPLRYTQLHLAVFGGKTLLKERQSEVNKQFKKNLARGTVMEETARVFPTWTEIESSIWLSGMSINVRCHFVERTEDLSSLIFELSKSVAWKPFNCGANAENHHLTKLKGRTGKDAKDAFKLMLEQVQGVTPNCADCIQQAYPTIKDLMAAYEALNDPASRAHMLALLPGSQGRPLGRALSTRIYHIFFGGNPKDKAF